VSVCRPCWRCCGFAPAYGSRAFPGLCSGEGVTFAQIVGKVMWPAFLWGVGTALGELPPYFMARAARLVRGCAVQRCSEPLDSFAWWRCWSPCLLCVGAVGARVWAFQSGEKLRELQDIEEEESETHEGPLPLLERAKVFMHEGIQRWGFWAILAAASIPNPVRGAAAALPFVGR